MIKKNGVYIMESAEIIGEVKIGKNSSVWNKVVIRGDESYIRIGKNTNIQDMSVIHGEHNMPVEIGDYVTIGHNAVIHCRKIGSYCIIGIGAILLMNTEVGEYSIVASGTVITENQIIPPRSLVMGIPGKIHRKIGGEDIKRIEKTAQDYLRLSSSHYEGKFGKIN